jgi:serine/threonine-protein kinase HipA
MLERIEGECAGAIIFIPSSKALSHSTESYKALSDEELANIIKTLSVRPLMAGEDGIRLSLARAQEKKQFMLKMDEYQFHLMGHPVLILLSLLIHDLMS